MTDFLLLLGKINLAMAAAVILVWLLRRPLRAQFGAPIAYALWLLVPIAGLASLLPPRVAAPLPAPAMPAQLPAPPLSVTPQIAHPAQRLAEHLTSLSAPAQTMVATHAPLFDYRTLDYAAVLFAAWVLGAVLVALYLARLQLRFHAAARLGEAGPAVVGFFRPRVVMPDGFQEQFTAPEQAAILAHERVHLMRQDARINALAALLRCLCWFNPLIHLGAVWLRADQELACDATALVGTVSRRDYGNALLKSQINATALPLGCDWPGSEHPLTERIALLKRKRPGTARRIAGMGLVVFAALFAGLSAWAAQPPVPAKLAVAPPNQIARANPPAINSVPDQNVGVNPPVADANPVTSGNQTDAAKTAGVNKPIPAAPSPSDIAPQPLPKDAPSSATVVASNELPATPTPSPSEASPSAAAALNDQPATPAQPAMPAEPAQVAAATPQAEPDLASAMKLLSKNTGGTHVCSPAAIGTVVSVQSDIPFSGTGIVLNRVQFSQIPYGSFGYNDQMQSLYSASQSKGVFTAVVPVASVKKLPALNNYVGQKVAIWPSVGRDWEGGMPYFQITDPRQLQLLSTALKDPKSTWCYLDYLQRQSAASDPTNSPQVHPGAAAPAAPAAPNQSTASVQPATPDSATKPVTVAAATPAPAGSDTVSPTEALQEKVLIEKARNSNPGGCPPIIGNITSVQTDPALSGTDIMLDNILPASMTGVGNQCMFFSKTAYARHGTVTVFNPTDAAKRYPLFDQYVGRRVAIWAFAPGNRDTRGDRTMDVLGGFLLLGSQSADASVAPSAQVHSGPALSAASVTPNQPTASVQPTAPQPSAKPIPVAAATPASVSADPASAMQLLSRPTGGTHVCSPTVIGTVESVQTDQRHFGTDIVLDHAIFANKPNYGGSSLWASKGNFIALIPGDFVKQFPPLDTYIGQKVAIWNQGELIEQPSQFIEQPSQMVLLSTALADPQKTVCFQLRQNPHY